MKAIVRGWLWRYYRFRRRRAAARAVILMYHRVLPRPGEDCLGICVSLTSFERQLAALKRSYAVVRMAELAAGLRAETLSRDAVVLTLDDGYRDNHCHALPALEARGLPATFFVPTDFVGRPRPSTDARLACLIESTSRPAVRLGGREIPLDSRESRHLAAHRILRRLNALDGAAREERLAELARELGVDERPAPDVDLPMDWRELRDLTRRGMTVGSHGVSHRRLAGLSAGELRRELEDSRRTLERRLEREVRFLAYPYGRPADVDRTVVRAAGRAGYEIGCTASPGSVGAASEPLLLRRLDVRASRPAALCFEIERALAEEEPAESFAR